MGSIYQAKCLCGFEKNIRVGGTMSDYQTHSYFPFFCKTCGLVEVNISSRKVRCPQSRIHRIVQYGLPPLSPKDDTDREMSWERYSAGKGPHLCPNCQRHHLIFQLQVMFD